MYILVGIPAGLLCIALPGIIIAQYFISISTLSSSYIVLFAALILSGTGILTLRYLYKHHLNVGIITMGAGMLLSVFTVSLAVPQYNSMIGLNQLCNQAKETAMKKGGVNYYYCEMTKGDNLDVYLGKPLKKLTISDLYKTNKIKTPAILFTWNKAIERNDSIQVFIKGKKTCQTGIYYSVEIE
jgi:hypothetical protein